MFAVLEASASRPGDQWFGYLGYASRPDLPAAPGPTLPDAVWMRAARGAVVRPRGRGTARSRRIPARAGIPTLGGGATAANESDSPPARTPHAFARVQEHLHAGNSYEVNLTYRLVPASPTSTR